MKKLNRFTVRRRSDGRVLASPCWVADTMKSRFFGLMGQEKLEEGAGLWIEPCNAVHSFFMRFAIDLVFIDHEGKVLKVIRDFKPWRMTLPVSGARATLELPVGGSNEVQIGDFVECIN